MAEELLELYVLEQEPIAKVCRELGLTTNQVYQIKWRLTQELSEELKEELDESG